MRFATVAKALVVIVAVIVAAAIGILLTFDFNAYKEVIAEAVHDATGRKLVIEGDLELRPGLVPTIAVEGVRFANAPWGSRPDMVRFERASVEVELMPLLAGDVLVKRVVLKGADILLESAGKGRANWVFDVPKAAQKPAADDAGAGFTIPTVNLVVIENARLTYRAGADGKPIVFVIDKLEGRVKDKDSPVKLNVEGAFNGNRYALAGTFGVVSELIRGGAWPIDFTVRAGGAEIKVTGAIAEPMTATGVELAFSAAGKDLSAMSGLAGAALPALGPYRIKGRLGQKGAGWRISGMEARVGNSALTGQLSIDPGGARPALQATLRATFLDLADFQEKTPSGGAPAPASPASQPPQDGDDGRVFSADPLPLEALNAVDVTASLRIDKVKSDRLQFTGATVDIALRDGLMRLRSLRFGYGGGEIKGEAEITAAASPAKANLRLKLIRLDVGRLLRETDTTDTVKAVLDGDIQLSGSGGSLRAFMAGLQGTTSLVVGKGAIDSQYVNLIGADVLRTIAPWAEEKKGTTVNCMVSRFLVRKGIATSRALLFDTEMVTVAGEGKIDLGKETLAFRLVPRPKQASLLSLAVPINVGGTLASPTAAPDTAEVVKKVAVGVVGTVINPLGLLVPLVSGGSEDKNPCVAALAAESGSAPTPAASKAAPEKPKEEFTPLEDIGGAIKGIGESIGEGLKSLFGQ